LIIMRTQALCKSLSFKRLSLAVALVAGAFSVQVHAEGFSAYAGATVGLSPSAQACPAGADCERIAGGAKLFGGWNVTPNVAAEINYFYFGATGSNVIGATTPGTVNKRVSARALTLGMNWNFEMLDIMTSHIRLGVARVRNVTDIQTTTSGVPSQVRSQDVKFTTSPYMGVGLSIPFNRHLRLTTGYDFIYVGGDGNRSRHLLSGGFQGEF
jgi:hypothetical protein